MTATASIERSDSKAKGGSRAPETLSLFAELDLALPKGGRPDSAARRKSAEQPEQLDLLGDPLRAARDLARKMPYIKGGRGHRRQAGHEIFRLLKASLEAANDNGRP